MFFSQSVEQMDVSQIIGIIVMALFPFIISFLMLPMAIVLAKSYDRRIQYILRKAQKLGIITPLEDIITLK